MTEVLRAEWTKARTVAGTAWLLAAVVALTAAVSVAAAAAASCPAARCGQDPAKLGLAGVYLGQAAVVVLAVLMVSGEYATGMMHVTLTAMPRRIRLLAGKAAVLTGLVVTAGTVAVLGSVAAGGLLLPRHGFDAAHGYSPFSLAEGPLLRAAAGSVLYLALIGLLSLGVATMVRDGATAIGIVLGLLFLFPVIARVVTNVHWQHALQEIAPMTAGLSIQATVAIASQPIAPWPGLGVLALWAAAALLAGALLLRMRDA